MPLIYVFFIVIAIVFPLSKLAVSMGGNRDGRIAGTDNNAAKFMVFMVFMILFVFAGFRGIVAEVNDEWIYRRRVTALSAVGFQEAIGSSSEIIDNFFYWIVGRIFPGESQWILVNYALITYGCFVYCIYKQCDNFELGILLLFLLNMVNTSFNTLQQMEAVAVSMLGIPFVQRRKFIKYAVVVVLAALIHSSAIVLIAVYFVANLKPWSWKFVGVAFLFVMIMVLFNTVAPNLFSRMDILEEYGDTYGKGVKGITVIVAFIPILFAFAMKSRFPDDDNAFNCSINMSLVYAMIYLISTQNKYVARFGMYIQPYLIYFYTKSISYLKKENLSTIVYAGLVVGYGATMVYFVQNIEYKFVSIFDLLKF